MPGVSVRVLGPAWAACLTKGAHTSLALSVRRKESYTWNHSWSLPSQATAVQSLHSLASFLRNPPGPCLNTMLNLFTSSAKEKGDTQSIGDKVTNCPYTHRCGTLKAFKTSPSSPPHAATTTATSSSSAFWQNERMGLKDGQMMTRRRRVRDEWELIMERESYNRPVGAIRGNLVISPHTHACASTHTHTYMQRALTQLLSHIASRCSAPSH